MVYSPGSRQIVTTEDAIFDELFASTIATTWQQHRDSLALRQPVSHIPLVTDTTERTGAVLNVYHVEEGNGDKLNDTPEEATAEKGYDNNFEVDHNEHTADEESSDCDTSGIPSEIAKAYIEPPEDNLHIMDRSGEIRCSERIWKPYPKYINVFEQWLGPMFARTHT